MSKISTARACLFCLKADGWRRTARLAYRAVREKITGRPPFQPAAWPQQVTIEVLNSCNLQCRHCYLHAQQRAARQIMGMDTFERLLPRIHPFLQHADQFNCSSVEALFHPRFFEMIARVRRINPRLTTVVNSNGMLLDERRIEKLMEHGLWRVTVSLDGCTAQTVESFKTGVRFESVLAALRRLRLLGGKRFRITTIFVAHSGNIHELALYPDFCADLQVDAINVTGLIAHNPEFAQKCVYSREGLPEVDNIFTAARRRAEERGLLFNCLGTRLNPLSCGWHDSLYVDINGNMAPCVLLATPTQMCLLDKCGRTPQVTWGNAFEADPVAAWRNQESVDFRWKLYENTLPVQCALCAIGHKVIC